MSDDEEYNAWLRDLERWAGVPLPAYAVADWDGETIVSGGGAGIGARATDGSTRVWNIPMHEVWHRRPGTRGDLVTVITRRPDRYYDDSAGLANLAIQEVKARGDVDTAQHNRAVEDLRTRLLRGELPSKPTAIDVDGEPAAFTVVALEHAWFARAELDDLVVTVLSCGIPADGMRLTRVDA